VRLLYESDSFFTLSLGGQIGLAVLSALLFALMMYVARRWTKGRHIGFRIGIALALFWAFVWLSPQIYYTYYLVIFDGLPLQVVVQRPPSAAKIFGLMCFAEESNLSAHSQGVLCWGMVLRSFFSSPQRSELTEE